MFEKPDTRWLAAVTWEKPVNLSGAEIGQIRRPLPVMTPAM